jgi:hypothetical protein
MNVFNFFNKINSMVPLIGGKPGEEDLNTPECAEIMRNINLIIKGEKASTSINILTICIATLVVEELKEASRSSSVKNIVLNLKRAIPVLHNRYFYRLLSQLGTIQKTKLDTEFDR